MIADSELRTSSVTYKTKSSYPTRVRGIIVTYTVSPSPILLPRFESIQKLFSYGLINDSFENSHLM